VSFRSYYIIEFVFDFLWKNFKFCEKGIELFCIPNISLIKDAEINFCYIRNEINKSKIKI